MRSPTTAWTERHALVALLLIALMLTCVSGLVEGQPVAVWVGVAATVSGLLALAFDAYAGLLIGLVAAGALTYLRTQTGQWAGENFAPSLVETVGLILTSGVSGAVGQTLRRGALARVRGEALEPAFGSMGLLPPELAGERLQDEVSRAAAHRRPLSLVLLEVDVRGSDLAEQGRSAALRAVSRILESRATSTDVPFALTSDRIGLIMPETGPVRAAEVVGEILQAVEAASFTFGSARIQGQVADAVDVHVGMSSYGAARDTADALLDAASAALNRSSSAGATP